MRPAADELFRLGVVAGTHGLRGDLRVRPLAPDAFALLDARRVFLRRSGEEPVACLPLRASVHKGQILLRLEGRESIDDVQALAGADVLVRRADLADPPAGEPYWLDLQGIAVVDRTLGDLGTLEDLFTTAAHDVYVVHGTYGEVLIPAVDAFITKIDHEARRMLVDLPAGLVPEVDEV